MLEGRHNRFQLVGKHHQNIYTAIGEIQKEQDYTEICINELAIGKKVKVAPIKKWNELLRHLESITAKYNTRPRLEYLQSIAANANISQNFPSEKFVLERIRENDEITFKKLVLEKIDFREFVVREICHQIKWFSKKCSRESDVKPYQAPSLFVYITYCKRNLSLMCLTIKSPIPLLENVSETPISYLHITSK